MGLSFKDGVEKRVPLLERCRRFRGCYVQVSMELRPEDLSLLERCPHFRGCYVQASMELGPEDVSLLADVQTSIYMYMYMYMCMLS